jgi:hypothetical protein
VECLALGVLRKKNASGLPVGSSSFNREKETRSPDGGSPALFLLPFMERPVLQKIPAPWSAILYKIAPMLYGVTHSLQSLTF